MGSGLGPNGDSATDSKDPVVYRLNKLSIKKGDVSSALAWDDLTGMRLDAGKVIEARAKEVLYVRDKEVYVKIPRRCFKIFVLGKYRKIIGKYRKS